MEATGRLPVPVPVPARPPAAAAIRFRWLDLLFAHWPVPVRRLRPHVPEGLEIDEFDGTAWVGLIPFTMRGVHARGVPPLPGVRAFHECNVRTYVSREGTPGVWFFSLDAASRLAVWGARALWHLNYVFARIDLRRSGDEVNYTVRRPGAGGLGLHCRWRVGPAAPPTRAGSFEHYAVERYVLYSASRSGRLYRGRIWHVPWRLHAAELLELRDDLVAATGIDLDGAAPPRVHAAPGPLDVEAWPLERLA